MQLGKMSILLRNQRLQREGKQIELLKEKYIIIDIKKMKELNRLETGEECL